MTTKLLFDIAWTHVTARVRQTLVGMAGVSMGVGFTIMMAGLMEGSQIDFLRQLKAAGASGIPRYLTDDLTDPRANIGGRGRPRRSALEHHCQSEHGHQGIGRPPTSRHREKNRGLDT